MNADSHALQPPSPVRDISVVVPTHNRPDKLALCLRALAAQTYPPDRFEVIVVDDGGDAALAPTLAPFRARLQLRLIEQGQGGPARARNTGARQGAGALLAFTDDDCEPGPDWLAALHAHVRRCPDHAIGGLTVNGLPGNSCSSASQLLVDYLYEHHSAAAASDGGGVSAPPFFTANNLAVPTALFHAVGGFDESFHLAAGEDREFCDRWQERGYRLLRAPNAIVWHAHALSLRSFWRQHLNYGRGAYQLRTARAARGRAGIAFEPLSFYGRLLTYPMRARGHRWPLVMALLVISQVANALGFVVEMVRRQTTAAGRVRLPR